jgi:hypothetical protein
MPIPVANHEYVIITKTLIHNTFHIEKYIGKCEGAYAGGIDWLFVNVARVKTPYHVKPCKIFSKWDEYYHLKEMRTLIENAKLARHNMEKRALNIILKRLVNEDFQW